MNISPFLYSNNCKIYSSIFDLNRCPVWNLLFVSLICEYNFKFECSAGSMV